MRALRNKMVAFSLLTFSSLGYCGISDDMDSFFTGAANYSSPGVSQGQMGGQYSGGSLSFRTPSKNVTPFNISLPSFSGGCNGIDAFMGAFSHISSEQLIALGKAIASNAAPFAFDLAVATLSPAIHNQYEKLRELANMVNQFQINSCETSAQLVAEAWPFEANQAVSSRVCSTVGSKQGFFSDSAASKYNCNNKGKGPEVTNSARSGSEFADVLQDNTNSTWKALNKSSLSLDTEMKEVLMTLVGTVIKGAGVTADAKSEYKYLPAKAADNKYLQAFLVGGETIDVHRCNETSNCIDVSQLDKKVTIPEEKSFNTKVRKIITELREIAASKDKVLTQAHMDFLDRTTLPIYKMILVDLAYSQSGSVTNPDSYAEVVALDYFYSYLDSLIESTYQAVAQEYAASNDPSVKQWRNDVREAQRRIQDRVQTAKQNINTYSEMMQRTMHLEKMMATGVTNQVISALDYSKQW